MSESRKQKGTAAGMGFSRPFSGLLTVSCKRHVASWNQGIIVYSSLFWNWTKPTIGTEIKGPRSGGGTETNAKSQNTVTEGTS